jgi:hypothetical protein
MENEEEYGQGMEETSPKALPAAADDDTGDGHELQPPTSKRRRLLNEQQQQQQKEESNGGLYIYICDLCDKTFNKQSSLARHKYEHSGIVVFIV